jgi:hypothetical protein
MTCACPSSSSASSVHTLEWAYIYIEAIEVDHECPVIDFLSPQGEFDLVSCLFVAVYIGFRSRERVVCGVGDILWGNDMVSAR